MSEEKIIYCVEYDFCGGHFEMNLPPENSEEEVKKIYAEWRHDLIPWSAKNIKLLKITLVAKVEQIA